ncbi:unnamed protein product, partial [Didymodactylos carnosus]
TSEGNQVIALGVLLGVLLLIFYGLMIVNTVRKKSTKENTETSSIKVQGVSTVAVDHFKKTCSITSVIITVLMFLIAAAALIIKAFLLKPIHNDIVNKYQTNQTLLYIPNDICSVINLQDFNMFTFPVACALIILYAILSKRSSFKKNLYKGYFAPPVPLDYFARIKRKLAAVVFAVTAADLLEIVYQVLTENTSNGEGVIVRYLIRIFQVLVIGFRYYPILVAIHIDTVVALFLATIYSWLDFSVGIVNQSLCSNYYPTDDLYEETNGSSTDDIKSLLDYYGTGSNLIAIDVCIDIPRYICLAYISIKLAELFIKKIRARMNLKKKSISTSLSLSREEKQLLSYIKHSIEARYVRYLFLPVDRRPKSKTLLSRIIPKKIYTIRDDFHYSLRVLSVYASAFMLVFFMTTNFCVKVIPSLATLHQSLTTIFNELFGENKFPLPEFVGPYVASIMFATVGVLLQLTLQLAAIRRNLFQVYRGDINELPHRATLNTVSLATSNFHFSGYFIGYVVWGYLSLAFLAFIIIIPIDAFIKFGSVEYVEGILKKIIPILLFMFFKMYMNKLLAQYAFLQHWGDVLALNNRRWLMIFLYFNAFLDAFLGVVSCVIRIVFTVIAAMVCMCRLDYSPLGRKLERFDSGFSAYVGYIYMEREHAHPVMLCFASYLYLNVKLNQTTANRNNENHHATNGKISPSPFTSDTRPIIRKTKEYNSRILQRWLLALTLIHNPLLVYTRKKFLIQKQQQNADVENMYRKDRVFSIRPSLISEHDLNQAWLKRI